MTILALAWDYTSQRYGVDGINSGAGLGEDGGVSSPTIDTDYTETIAQANRGFFDHYIDLGSNQTSFWLHFDLYRPTQSSNTRATLIEFWSESKTLQYTLESMTTGATNHAFYKSTNGTSGDTQIGSSLSFTQDARHQIDIWINVGSSGDVEVWVDGTKSSAIDFSGDTTTNGDNAIRYITFRSRVKNETTCYSQIIASTQKTVGWKLCYLRSTTTTGSPFTQWSGSSTALFPAVDTASPTGAAYQGFNTASNDQTHMFATRDIPAAAAGMVVKAVAVAGTFNVSHDSTPQNVRLCVYTSSTLYESATQTIGYGNGDVWAMNIWETNPNTGNAWSQAEVNAAFYGAKSKA